MKLFHQVASAHQGQCFSLVAKRTQASEEAVAILAERLFPLFYGKIAEEIATKAGMTAFLGQIERDPCADALTEARALGDPELRVRGQKHASWFISQGALTGDVLKPILAEAGVGVEAFARVLPYIAILMMGVIAKRLEAPLAALRLQERKRTPVGLATERLSGFASFFRARTVLDGRDNDAASGRSVAVH